MTPTTAGKTTTRQARAAESDSFMARGSAARLAIRPFPRKSPLLESPGRPYAEFLERSQQAFTKGEP